MGTTGQSITLANSIIGVGILAMPFCFQQCGVLLATLILLFMGLVSRLCCHFLLKSALFARRRNFEFLAFHVFGPAGKMAVELGIIGFLMGTCIAYFVVVGDLGPQIIAKMFNINQSDILRTSIMVIVSLVCVLPLGLLRNVDSLSNVSAATIGFYFCLVIKVITEAASQLLTPDWSAGLELWKPQGVLQCVPIFSMALFCQTQLFEIFESLPMLSLEKMNAVTKNAINTCTTVYFTLGLFGYIAFSKQEISGNILMSLSPTMTSDVIKLGFVMSLACSFPLIIFPCRASLYSLLYKKVHHSQHDHIINHSIPERTFRCMTVGIVGAALVVSLLVPTIELVLGLAGSTIGVLVCVIFPAACFLRLTTKNTNERVLAKVVLVLGLVILVLGTYANLQAAESSHEKYDEKHITQERIDKMVEDFFHSKKMDNGEGMKTKKLEPVSKAEIKEKEAVLDYEVQPPNPVPPESQPSNNNDPQKPDNPPIEIKKSLKEQEIDSEVDKVSETHPKNLQKLTNREAKKEEKIETPKIEGVKEMSNKHNIDFIKQAQLIETIKEHGEEQKALMKEQHEILENIIKTKQELQKNNNNEAKKIAVESIQKIANVAIQSLSAVSEEPSDNLLKKDQSDNANEAVKKIADVAVEAIKELKNQPLKPEPIQNDESLIVNAAPPEVNQNEPIVQNAIPPVQNVNNIQDAPAKYVESQVVNNEPNRVINDVPVVNNSPVINNAPVAIAPVVNNAPVANNAPIANNVPVANNVAPVANNAPLSNYAPVAHNVPMVNNNPVANNVPAANNVPVVNNAPVANNVPFSNYVPVVNNNPVANNIPAANNIQVVHNAPVANNVPLSDYAPVANNVPVVNNNLVANNVPAANNVPVVNNAPVANNVPLSNYVPAANNVPVVNNAPVANNVPLSNYAPVANNVPMVNNNPVANNVPSANNVPVVNNAPVANNVPLSNYAAVANNVPVVNNNLVANNVPAANNVPVVNNAPVANNVPLSNYAAVANNVPVVNNNLVAKNVPAANNVPVVNNAPVANNVPLSNYAAVANNVPVVNNNLVANNVPAANNVPVVNNAPVANNVPLSNYAAVANNVPVVNNNLVANNVPAANNVPVVNNAPVANNVPLSNYAAVANNVPVVNNNLVANNLPAANNVPVVNNAPVANNVLAVNNIPMANNVPAANNAPMVNNAPVVNNPPVVNKPASIVTSNKIDTIPIQSNIAQEKQLGEQIKEHSHMPDEPQSYKQGEDAQKKPQDNTNLLNSVPLPIAMNGNFKAAETRQVVKNLEMYDDKPINNIETNDALPRQKREVVDCTNKESLRVEDREICKSLVNTQEIDKQELLPNVDLNDALSKGLPLVDVNMNVVYHMRSLKSYKEEKRR